MRETNGLKASPGEYRISEECPGSADGFFLDGQGGGVEDLSGRGHGEHPRQAVEWSSDPSTGGGVAAEGSCVRGIRVRLSNGHTRIFPQGKAH